MLNVIKSALFASLFFAGIFIISQADQSKFIQIIIGFGMAFAAYGYFIGSKHQIKNQFLWLIVLGIVVRVYLLFVFPNLSDDIYRFYWDGLLSQSGINPYSFRPDQILALQALPDGISKALFDQLNSPAYYTIYPPLSQVMFYLAGFTASIGGFSIALKIIFLVFELIGLRWMLMTFRSMDIPRNNVFIYLLNPLVIVEGIGNLHFELILVSFLALFIYYLFTRAYSTSSLFYGFSVLAKLTPALLGPLILYYLASTKRIFLFLIIAASLCLISFTPVFSSMNFMNLGESIDLYFRKFEFNASIYYLLRGIGKFISGYNLIAYIGPFLAFLSIGLIIKFARRLNSLDNVHFIKYALYSYTVYLLLSTTVHPWYLLPLIFLAAFRKSYIILIWSFLITLSYYTYSVEGWHESPLLLVLEYAPIYILLAIFYWRNELHPIIRL